MMACALETSLVSGTLLIICYFSGGPGSCLSICLWRELLHVDDSAPAMRCILIESLVRSYPFSNRSWNSFSSDSVKSILVKVFCSVPERGISSCIMYSYVCSIVNRFLFLISLFMDSHVARASRALRKVVPR